MENEKITISVDEYKELLEFKVKFNVLKSAALDYGYLSEIERSIYGVPKAMEIRKDDAGRD